MVLGAAAGGGLPQWNCTAGNSGAYWRGAASGAHPFAPASQSSIAVGQPGSWTLVNASPDVRQQIIAQPALWPTAAPGSDARRSPITSVVITDGDLDHIAGLLTLRERTPFRLLTTKPILDLLDANPVFEALARDVVQREAIQIDSSVELDAGLIAQVFPAPGKVPLYMERTDAPVVTDELTPSTLALELRTGLARAFYVPSCAALTDDLAARLDGADLVLFDGTVYHDDDMARAGVGDKTGRRMGHMPMVGADGSLEGFKPLTIGRKIFIHINNTNPVWQPDSAARRAVTEAGWEIAYDGMEIEL